MIEKAIFPNQIQCKDEKRIIYIGSESCENIVLKHIKNFLFEKFEKKVVLVLPILAEKSFKIFNEEINILVKSRKIKEIVLNDIGSIVYFRKKHKKLKINIGRVLMISFEKSYLCNMYLKGFIDKFNINAIEIDGAFDIKKLRGILPIHYHTPASIIAITRFCPWEKIWNTENCALSCNKKVNRIVSPKLGYDLYMKECAYLSINNLRDNGFKRIVEHI